MSTKFEIFIGKNGDHYFRLKAANGEIILASEGYKIKEGCTKGIESVRKNATTIANYSKKIVAGGKFHFNLKATNGEIIGTSETYNTEQARDNGIHSVMKNAPIAKLVDLTEKNK